MMSISIATAQSTISTDVRTNGKLIRQLMQEACKASARLIHFPEGALSGYTKSQIKHWENVDWPVVQEELEETATLARELSL